MTTAAENQSPVPEVAQTDWFLQALVDLADNSNQEFDITLQVSGMLVSGRLVSAKSYFEGFAEDFASPISGDYAESMKKLFMQFVETDENQLFPQFVHLKNARFFNIGGNPIPMNRGVWWRGRICEVGGFCAGSIASTKE
jgi:hypothetical protein